MMTPPDPMKEIEVLQEIIARHEKHAFVVKALLATVLTGLAALVFSLNKRMEVIEVVVVGLLAVLTFGLWALTHAAIVSAAVSRVGKIEHNIRWRAAYDGPKISVSMENVNANAFWSAARYKTNSIPLTIGLLAVAIIAWGADRFNGGNLEAMLTHTNLMSQAVASRYLGEQIITLESSTIEDDQIVMRAALASRECEVVLIQGSSEYGPRWDVVRHQCKVAPASPEALPFPQSIPLECQQAVASDEG